MIIISVIGVASGICSAGLIALINFALHHTHIRISIISFGFIVLVVAKILASACSQQLLYRTSVRMILKLSLELSREFACSSYRKAESIGTARTIAVIADDVGVVGSAIQSVPNIIVNLAVLAGCSVYLIWLSWKAFAAIVLMASIGVVLYKFMLAKAQVSLKLAREKRDLIYKHLRAMAEGIKEIGINRSKREDFLENHLSKAIEDANTHGMKAVNHYVVADTCSQFVFYSILGLLLFAVPMVANLSVEMLTGYVFAALYLMNPIWGILYSLPALQRGQNSLEKIQQFRDSLSFREETKGGKGGFPRNWGSLRMEKVTFSYENVDESNPGFALGPIDFEIHPGELIFVVGGNGSGKSTFVKVLCGLYVPESGKIMLSGRTVNDLDRDDYRQVFSVIFSDYFLFDMLLGIPDAALEERIKDYMVRLQLDKKVKVVDGHFSTTELSQGQRRRLALLTAYLEDRPIYIFDEWAADQDPAYKDVFYRIILPELRRSGKGVVVITHDDRYYSLGDRIVRLDYGKVVSPDGAGRLTSNAVPQVEGSRSQPR
jgi:putative pyoverdin transport system ATP-binding/permease protein